jgi:hypothetical protein
MVWLLVTQPPASGNGAPAACLPVDGVPGARPCTGPYPKLDLVAADTDRLMVAYALGI